MGVHSLRNGCKTGTYRAIVQSAEAIIHREAFDKYPFCFISQNKNYSFSFHVVLFPHVYVKSIGYTLQLYAGTPGANRW